MRWFLVPLALAGCGLAPTPVPPRPHVVVVSLDTTRADRIGAYGYDKARTETIDAIAASGQRYTRAFSPLPLTIPAHSTLFTGLVPPHHGVRNNGSAVLDARFTTLAEHLQAAGWRTAASVSAYVTMRQWGFDQGFDAYFDALGEIRDNQWRTERPAEPVVDDALGWLSQQPDGAPVFLWLHFYDAHLPLTPPPQYIDPADPRPYDAEIAYVDDQLQRVVEALGDAPVLWVVVADHGESYGEHGERDHGLFTYNATQHVPFLIAGPGIAPAVIDTPVSLADVTPTVLHHVGLPIPDGLDGRVVPPAATEPVYMEAWTLAQRFELAPHVALTDGRWKLIDTPRPELYDLQADWGETRDVSADHADVVARMRQTLADLDMPPPAAGTSVDASTAEALAALGYVDGGQEVADRGSLSDPKDHAALIADVYAAEGRDADGDIEGAAQAFTALSGRYPHVREFVVRAAGHWSRIDRHAEALAALEGALPHLPASAELLSLHGRVLAALSRFTEASAAFEAAAAVADDKDTLRAYALQTLRSGGQTATARVKAEAWHGERPDDAAVAGFLGILWAMDGRDADASPLLDAALTLDRPGVGVAWMRAQIAAAQGDLPAARALLAREIAVYPGRLRAAVVLTRVCRVLSCWDDSIDAADRVLGAYPANVEMWFAKAEALYSLGRYDDARAAVASGLVIAPEDPELLRLDANLLAQAGDMAAGARRFEQAKAAKARAQSGGALTDTPGVEDGSTWDEALPVPVAPHR